MQESTARLPTRAETLWDEEPVSILSWPGRELGGAGEGRKESGTKPPSQPWAWLLRSMLVFNQFYVRILMVVFTQLQEGRRERQRIQSKDCCISELDTDQIKVDNIFLLMLVFTSKFSDLSQMS